MQQWKRRGKSPKRRPKADIRRPSTILVVLWLLTVELPLQPMGLEEPQETVQVEFQEPGTTFVELGSMALTSSYAHVHIPFPISVLEQRLYYIKAISNRMDVLEIPSSVPEKEKANMRKRLQFLQHYIRHVYEELQAEMDEVNEAFLHHTGEDVEVRNKRQLIVGAIIAATAAGAAAGGATAAFTSTDLNKVVENEEGVLATTVGENLLKIHQNTQDVITLNRTIALMEEELKNQFIGRSKLVEFDQALLRATMLTQIVSTQFKSTAKVIHAARRGKLDVQALPTTVWRTTFEELNERAVAEGFELAIKGPEELESLQTTTLIDPIGKTIHIVAHVALFRPGEHLQLYRYIEVPQEIPLEDDNGKQVFTTLSPVETLLGITRDQTTYVTLTSEELDSCQTFQHRSLWFCAQKTRYKKSFPTCLLALFNNDADLIEKRCSRTLTTEVSKVTRISNAKWIIFESVEVTYIINCPNQETRRKNIRGHALMTLAEGCEVSSPLRAFSRPKFEESLSIMAHFSNTPLPSPDIWVLNETKPMIQNVVQQLLRTVGQRVPEDQVKAFVEFNKKLEEAKQVATTFNPFHNFVGWILHQLIPIFGVILPVFLLSYLAAKVLWPYLREWTDKVKKQGVAVPVMEPMQLSTLDEREELNDVDRECGNSRWSQPAFDAQSVTTIMLSIEQLRAQLIANQDQTTKLADRLEKRDLRALNRRTTPDPQPTVNLNIRSVPTNASNPEPTTLGTSVLPPGPSSAPR